MKYQKNVTFGLPCTYAIITQPSCFYCWNTLHDRVDEAVVSVLRLLYAILIQFWFLVSVLSQVLYVLNLMPWRRRRILNARWQPKFCTADLRSCELQI